MRANLGSPRIDVQPGAKLDVVGTAALVAKERLSNGDLVAICTKAHKNLSEERHLLLTHRSLPDGCKKAFLVNFLKGCKPEDLLGMQSGSPAKDV